ncbi:hypothetical protein HYH03_008677 [Edaphochlamys debaryana]|uniref:Uncharacterized protein n=1 Tax=Edaphochlamys debaryana TaxID=47281 RepID=A0A836BZ61_9CHLO|nr:hypothetical protein HYH03_008677 [Edaphochlamys debaryana]|eukprot:KAG2493014.1 hypothetical protein HYH03_008677 [Edaphochlamys debaryana]
MAANRGAKIEERGRLTKLVRLCHLSSAYLYCVLPQLPETWSWLPPEELPLIQQCAALPSLEERKRFAAEVVPRMGVKALPAWYTSEPRPKARADAGRPYVWTTPVVEIDEALAAARLKAGNYNKLGAFTHGATVVIADGFELYCQLRVSSKTPKHVGCSLQNATPAVLALGQPVHNLMTPGKCLIGVWRGGPGGSSLKGYRCTFRATDWIQVGYARGYHEALAFTLPPPPPPRPAPPPSPSPSPTAASEGAAADGAAPGGAGTGGGAAAGAAAAPAGGVPSGSAATLLAPFVWEGADDFATDSESSVLLLLAVWMAANRGAKIEERGRLTKLVRLCHLSSAYLYCVLPQLPETWSWLPPEELPLIQQCAALPSLEERKRFAAEVVPRMGVKALPAWYTSEPRPKARADAGRPYVWTTPVVEIDEALAAARLKAGNYNKLGAFTHGATVVIADGFELYCQLRVSSKTPKHVGCSLQNATPAVLALGQPVHNLMTPGKCLIGVWRGGPGGSSLKGYRCTFRATDWIQVGYARGYHEALAFTLPPPPPPRPAPPPSPSPSPTAASEGAAADGAAPGGAGTGGGAAAGAAAAPAGGVPSGSAATLLAPFVWEGKVWGYLTWSD